MHTLKSINVLLILALVGLSLTACDTFEQRDRTYTGPDQLEFAPLSGTVDEGAGTIATNVQLIGPQRDSDLTVTFSVDSESTAQEGAEYTLPSTSVTIPAGESTAPVSINVLDNSIDDGDTNYQLILTLQDSDGAVAAENLRTFTLTIRGVDEPAP